ncbi:MAG: hypothetical protein OCD01_02990 [Fibrobacterales bacterium]
MIEDTSLTLSMHYMETGITAALGRPVTPSQNMLLIIDGSQGDCVDLSAKGWRVNNLLFNYPDDGNFPSQCSVASTSIYSEWTAQIDFKCDAVVLGPQLNYVEDGVGFLKKIHSLLTAQGVIYATVENRFYYQRLIDKSTRELLPWPVHPPKGMSYTQGEVESMISKCELTLKNIEPVVDSLFYNEQYTRWQKVNGIDCQVMLPNDPEQRRSYFIKEFALVIENGSTEIITAANMVEGVDVDAVHKQIQAFLADGQTNVVQGMLDTIFTQGRATDMTYNLYGIYYFYLGDAQKAYIYFIDAIQRNASVSDYYFNLYDAAKSIGVENEVVVLLQAAIKQHPHLQSVLTELTQ